MLGRRTRRPDIGVKAFAASSGAGTPRAHRSGSRCPGSGPAVRGSGLARCWPTKAYPSQANRRSLRERGITAVIPDKEDRRRVRIAKCRLDGRLSAFDAEAYKERNAVERTIGRLKCYRAVSTRFDELAARYAATVQVAMLLEWTSSS